MKFVGLHQFAGPGGRGEQQLDNALLRCLCCPPYYLARDGSGSGSGRVGEEPGRSLSTPVTAECSPARDGELAGVKPARQGPRPAGGQGRRQGGDGPPGSGH